MNPRDYSTWTRFADHPIFAEKSRPAAEWSSEPSTYDDFGCNEFLAEWYIHTDPQLPTDVQEAIAARDIKNFATACHEVHQAYGPVDHELFILDDFTVLVSLRCDNFHVEFYGHDYGDGGQILSVYILKPIEEEFTVDSVSEFVPTLQSLLS